jgi:hypothetical protein
VVVSAYVPMRDLPYRERVERYEDNRRYYLPGAIEAAERKLAGLYREASRISPDLLEGKSAFNEAWDREIVVAKLEAALRGNDETTMLGDGL